MRKTASILSIILIFSSITSLLAQNVSYASEGLIFNISPSYSKIQSKDFSSDIKAKVGFNVEVGYFMKLNRIISIGAGLGYSYYNSDISLDSSNQKFPDVIDIDGHNVIKNISTDQSYEEVKIGYLDVPLYIEFGDPNIDQIGFYGRIGFKVSFPVNSDLYGEGTYTSWGDYPGCPVVLYNIPELGYYTDEPIYSNKEKVKLNPVIFSVLLSGGITIPVSDILILKVGANVNYGLSGISEVNEENNVGYSKLLNNSSKTSVNSVGVEIGVIYSLRLY
jgi:hypothetical protein